MKSIRLLLVLALALAMLVGSVGCKSDKDVAARVNGEVIKKTELDNQVEQLKKQYPQMFQGPDGEGRLLDFKKRLLENLINQKLVLQAAKDMKVIVSDTEIKNQVTQLQSSFKTKEEFEAALKNAGMSLEGLEGQIRDQILNQKLVDKLGKAAATPAEADIKRYYDSNKEQFKEKAAKRTSHILFKETDKATAVKVLAEVRAGGNFASLAKKYSTDTGSAAKGGDLGWPNTPYVPEFAAAVARLGKGQVSEVVKTQFGWHIIKVTDERKDRQKTYAEVKTSIIEIMKSQTRADAYQKFLDEQRKKAKIEILIPELAKDAVPTPTEMPSQDGSKEATGTKK